MRNMKEARLVFLLSRALVKSQQALHSPGAIASLTGLTKPPSPVWQASVAGTERRGPLAAPHQTKMTSSSSQQPRSPVTLQLDESCFSNGNGTTGRTSCASPVAPPAVNSHQQQGVLFLLEKGHRECVAAASRSPESLWDKTEAKFSDVGWSPRGLSLSLSSCPWALGHWKGDMGNVPGAQF